MLLWFKSPGTQHRLALFFNQNCSVILSVSFSTPIRPRLGFELDFPIPPKFEIEAPREGLRGGIAGSLSFRGIGTGAAHADGRGFVTISLAQRHFDFLGFKALGRSGQELSLLIRHNAGSCGAVSVAERFRLLALSTTSSIWMLLVSNGSMVPVGGKCKTKNAAKEEKNRKNGASTQG